MSDAADPIRREDVWDMAMLFMSRWNRRDPDQPATAGNRILSGTPLFDKTLELARFLAEPTPTLIEVAGGGHPPERLEAELNDNQGEA